jgi:hypothetical protein
MIIKITLGSATRLLCTDTLFKAHAPSDYDKGERMAYFSKPSRQDATMLRMSNALQLQTRRALYLQVSQILRGNCPQLWVQPLLAPQLVHRTCDTLSKQQLTA